MNKIPVEIFGRTYIVKSSESEEYITKIADYIDNCMKKISKVDNRFDLAMISTLTSINIADEYFKAAAAADNLRKQTIVYSDELSKARDEIKQLKIMLSSKK